MYIRRSQVKEMYLNFCDFSGERSKKLNAAYLAQSIKAPPYHRLAVQISITALCLITCKAGDKNADSAWLRLVYADAEEILRSECAAAYRVRGDAT